MGPLLLAAVLGGVVGAGLLWALSALSGDGDELAAQLETLQARLASLETQEPFDTEALDARFGAIETRFADLPVVAETDLAPLQQALAALEAELAAQSERLIALPAASDSSDLTATVSELQTQMAAIQAEVAAVGEGVPSQPDDTLVARIEALESARPIAAADAVPSAELADLNAAVTELRADVDAVATIDTEAFATTSAVSDFDVRVSQLSDDIGSIEASVNDMRSSLDERIASMSGEIENQVGEVSRSLDGLTTRTDEVVAQIEDVRTSVGELGGTVETLQASSETNQASLQDITTRIDDLTGSVFALGNDIDAVAGRIDAPGDRERAIAAVALAGLQTSVDRGTPYATYLETLTSSGLVPDATRNVLNAGAASGVATRSELEAGWAELASQARRAAVRSEASSGVAGIFAGARSLIDIAPSNPGEGDEPNALVAQISRHLDAGALDRAVLAWQRLPEASREATQDWGKAAQLRLGIERALRDTADAVLVDQMAEGASDNG